MGTARPESVPRLAGRGDEQRLLGQALAEAASGRPRAVVVHGEAGVGKTRLVREVCKADGVGELEVLWGTCVHFGAASLPFAPVVGALQTWLARIDDAERGEVLAGAEELVRLLPTLGGRPADEPGRLLPVIDRVFNRIAAQRPTIVVVDDLHWADVSSLDVLAYLISGFRDQRLLLVATCRDENRPDGHPLHGWLADMRRMPGFTEMHLDRLDLEGTEQQVAGLLGRTTDVGLAAEILERSGGNPYLTELLVREMSGDEPTLPKAAPRALREALMAKWHRLSDEARQAARVLAVGGRPVDFEVLVRVAVDHGAATLSNSLAEAEEHGVVQRDADGRYWFRHPLLAEVLYDHMPPGEAGRVHATYAEVLSSASATSDGRLAADLAVHHERAANFDEAFCWSIRAADFAAALHASSEEAAHLERACSLWSESSEHVRGSESDRVDLLLRASRADDRAGRLDSAIALVEQAIELVDRDQLPLLASTLLSEWCGLSWQRVASGKSVRLELFEALRLTDAFPDSAERARALAGLADNEHWAGLREAAVAHAEQAVQVARRSGSELALAAALNSRAAASIGWTTSAALQDVEEAFRLAKTCGSAADVTHATIWRVNLLHELGRISDAATAAREVFEQGLRGGDLNWGYFLAGMAAAELLYLGRWDECRDLLREALAARRGGIPGALVRLTAAQLAVRTGDRAQARQHLDRALELVSVDFPGLRGSIAEVGAEVLLAEGDPAGALDWVLTLMELEVNLDPDDVAEMLVWVAAAAADVAQAARDSGDRAGAAHAVTALEDLVATFPVEPCSPDNAEDVVRRLRQVLLTAEVARCRGDGGQAALWEQAVEKSRAGQARWDEATSLWRWGQTALAERAPRAQVGQILREAHAIATELGAQPLAAHVESLARLAKVSLTKPSRVEDTEALPVVLARLTGREREILRFLVAGRSNTEIATSLVISAKTVSVHVSSILRKTSTSSRTQAAELARRLGM